MTSFPAPIRNDPGQSDPGQSDPGRNEPGQNYAGQSTPTSPDLASTQHVLNARQQPAQQQAPQHRGADPQR